MTDDTEHQQQSLFDPSPAIPPRATAPFVRGSETSEKAATEILPLRAPQLILVYEAIRDCGVYGMTDEEISRKLDMNPSSARPRRVELRESGWIKPSGVRKSRSGRDMQVWIAAR